MAYGLRRPVDDVFGSLRSGCSALDTSITSDAFVSLPTDFTTNLYTPMVIADDTQAIFEVVYITAHSSGSNAVTVVRGREGTTARQWNAGTVVRAAPTTRDALKALPSSSYTGLADAHVGFRVTDTSSYLTKQKTLNQGYVGSAGFLPGGMSKGVASDYVASADMVPIIKAGHYIGQTSGGTVEVTLPGDAFPNAIISIVATKFKPGSAATFNQPLDCRKVYRSGPTDTAMGPILSFGCCDYSFNLLPDGTFVNFSFIVVGC